MPKVQKFTRRVPSPEMKISDATLRLHAGYTLKRAMNVMQADLARTLKPFGLRMITYSALVMIADNPGMRQAQLADALAIERPNLVVIIDGLENRELITRDIVPTDRRAYSLQVTLAGKRLYDKAFKAILAHEAEILSILSDQEREQMLAAMCLIEAAEEHWRTLHQEKKTGD